MTTVAFLTTTNKPFSLPRVKLMSVNRLDDLAPVVFRYRAQLLDRYRSSPPQFVPGWPFTLDIIQPMTTYVIAVKREMRSELSLKHALSQIRGIDELRVIDDANPYIARIEASDLAIDEVRVRTCGYVRQNVDELPLIAAIDKVVLASRVATISLSAFDSAMCGNRRHYHERHEVHEGRRKGKDVPICCRFDVPMRLPPLNSHEGGPSCFYTVV